MNDSRKTRQKATSPTQPRQRLDPELTALMRLVEAERCDEVEAAARRILNSRPNHPLALKALGFALIGLDRCEEALPIVEFAAERYPQDPELHNNLGIVLSTLMRWDEAIRCFKRSLEIRPKDYEVLKNCGVALVRMHKFGEAVPYFLKAIEHHPGDYVEAVARLAYALLASNRNDEAWTCLHELWKDDPKDSGVLSQLVSASLKTCTWEGIEPKLGALREQTVAYRDLLDTPFVLLAFPGVTSEEQLRVASNNARHSIPASALTAPQPKWASVNEGPGPRQRLRIGYLSGDYRSHPVGLIIPQVIELHDRGRLEVFGYSTGPGEESEIRRRLAGAFDHFVDLREASVAETAERIRSDAIDILVDLSGWTAEGRPEALALRCAPVQVNWLGYAGTIGHAKLADYLLGDPVVTPLEDQAYYTETLAHLPNCYLPADTTIELADPPARNDAGLPAEGFVFCSFNNSYKFNPAVFDLWCRLLRETPGSVLWLSQPGGSAGERLQKEVAARGVDPARLILAARVGSRIDHLSRLQLADLALDPFPYNSHSTGIDVLWAGVPMVSLLGETFPGRVGASLLRAAGLPELVARSPDEYGELALALVRDPDRLRELRARLVASRRHSPLFDMPNFVRSLEELYVRMWQGFVTGNRAVLD